LTRDPITATLVPTFARESTPENSMACLFGMNFLLTTLLLACQNPQAGPKVRIMTDAGPMQTTLLGWEGGHPQVDSEIAVDSWWSVNFDHQTTFASGWTLALSDGAWLPGEPVEGAQTPTWKLSGLPEVEAFEIDTLWLQAFGRTRLPQTRKEEDQLWARTPDGGLDRLRGYLLEWTPEGIAFETSVKQRMVPWEQVDGLAVLVESLPQQPQAVWLQLINGGVLSARIFSTTDDAFQLELPWGTAWNLPFSAVHRIRQRSGVEEWALETWEVQEMPAAEALDWTPRVGKSVEGRPLRIVDNLVYAQGIGVKAQTVLAKTTSSAGTLFLTVGVDQEVQNFRSPQAVIFQVFLDDVLLTETEPKTVGSAAQTMLVAIPHAGQIRLVAKPEGVLSFGAHADWCDIVWKATQTP